MPAKRAERVAWAITPPYGKLILLSERSVSAGTAFSLSRLWRQLPRRGSQGRSGIWDALRGNPAQGTAQTKTAVLFLKKPK